MQSGYTLGVYVNSRSMEETCVLIGKRNIFFSRYLGKFIVNITFVHLRLRKGKLTLDQ